MTIVIDSKPDLVTTLLAGVTPLFLGVILAGIGWLVRGRTEARKQSKADAIKAYRELMGLSVILPQTVVTRSASVLNADYHERLSEHFALGTKLGDINHDESQRYQLRNEELVAQITELIRVEFRYCAALSVYFVKDKKIQSLIDDIYNYRVVKPGRILKGEEKDMLQAELERLFAEAAIETTATFKDPLDKLLKEVKEKLF